MVFHVTGCKSIYTVNEGVEFSVRLSSMPNEWIPLKYIYYKRDNRRSNRFEFTNYSIRGYVVNTTVLSKNDKSSTKLISVRICDLNITDSVQFRWLQTIKVELSSRKRKIWVLDNVTIVFNGSTLLQDNFSSSVLK